LAQHEASPVTLEKPRVLLARPEAAFGDYRLARGFGTAR
jgi:hypothetical protein